MLFRIDCHCLVIGTWVGSVLKYVVIRADNLRCLDTHACTNFDRLEPSVILPRDGKAAELSEPMESEDQASAVGVKKL